MDRTVDRPATLAVPTSEEAAQAVRDAERLFMRNLGSWSCDLLALRRIGLTRHAWSGGSSTDADVCSPRNRAA